MNKQQLIDSLALATGYTKAGIARILDAQAAIVGEALNQGGEVTLPGIGKLKTVEKAARQGRNPQTGEPVTIAARTNVKFTVSKTLKDMVN